MGLTDTKKARAQLQMEPVQSPGVICNLRRNQLQALTSSRTVRWRSPLSAGAALEQGPAVTSLWKASSERLRG